MTNPNYPSKSQGGLLGVFEPPSKPVGHWRIGGPRGLAFATFRKPRLLTRILCRYLLEWEWQDA